MEDEKDHLESFFPQKNLYLSPSQGERKIEQKIQFFVGKKNFIRKDP